MKNMIDLYQGYDFLDTIKHESEINSSFVARYATEEEYTELPDEEFKTSPWSLPEIDLYELLNNVSPEKLGTVLQERIDQQLQTEKEIHNITDDDPYFEMSRGYHTGVLWVTRKVKCPVDKVHRIKMKYQGIWLKAQKEKQEYQKYLELKEKFE